jgi:hypothetical protein
MQRVLTGLCLCFALFGVVGQVDADDFASVEEKIGDFLDRKGLRRGYDQAKGRMILTGMGETKAEAICDVLTEYASVISSSVTTEKRLPLQSIETAYWVLINGEQKGPLETVQLVQLKREGTLTSDTLVWKDGMAAWSKAGEQKDLQMLLSSASPPPSPSSVETKASQQIMDGLEVEAVRSSESTWTGNTEEFRSEGHTEIQFSDVKNHERAMKIECSFRESGDLMSTQHQELMIKGDLGLHDFLDMLEGERKQVKKGERRLFSLWFASDNLRALGVLMLLKFPTDPEKGAKNDEENKTANDETTKARERPPWIDNPQSFFNEPKPDMVLAVGMHQIKDRTPDRLRAARKVAEMKAEAKIVQAIRAETVTNEGSNSTSLVRGLLQLAFWISGDDQVFVLVGWDREHEKLKELKN